MRKAGAGLQHASVCALVSNLDAIYPDSCDGDPSCACQSAAASCACDSGQSQYCDCPLGCTSWSDRVKLFGVSPSAENAAAGSTDPIYSFKQWVKSSGHRDNLMSASRKQLGVGQYSGSGSCWNSYWVQNFAGGTPTVPSLVAGAHYPQTGGTTTDIKFWVNYYHASGAPTLARVNIGGTCHALI